MNTQIAQLRVQNITQCSIDTDRISELVSMINKNIKPLKRLTEDEIHIRVMYIVSDEVNSYGGLFALNELESLADLLIDSPVLVGHQKDNLPVARNFHAEIELKDDKRWVKSYFYWLKESKGSDSLQKNIDGGLYKECSIGFTFNYPECTICSNDIRRCPHEPFSKYKSGDAMQVCYYYYKGIDRVLETSFVYRGAVPDTSISDNLFEHPLSIAASYTHQDAAINKIRPDNWYLATPYYDGLEIDFTKKSSRISVDHKIERLQHEDIIIKQLQKLPFDLRNQKAIIVGYQGKKRCSKEMLIDFLSGDKTDVTTVDVKLVPNDLLLKYSKIISELHGFSLLHIHTIKGSEIEQQKSEFMTKDGIQLYPLHPRPVFSKDCETESYHYQFYTSDNQNGYIELMIPNRLIFYIENFSTDLLRKGRRMLARETAEKIQFQHFARISHGKVLNQNSENQFELIDDSHDKKIKFRIQKIRLNGQKKYLVQAI